MSGVLEAVGVTKAYCGATVLEPTSLVLERGKTTALIGPSGCGKSTLLRILVGLVAPDGGQVHFHGEPVTERNVALLRKRLGYVIQDGGLFPHLTGRANVLLLARHLGREKEAGKYLGELCEMVHLPCEVLDRYPAELSGGQRQRVSLLRALVLKPEVLLLDEPMGALDPMIRSALQEDLKVICRTLGQAVLLVTHDLAEAAYLGNTIVLMRGGAIVQRGGFRALVDAPEDPFVTRFVQAQRLFDMREGGCV